MRDNDYTFIEARLQQASFDPSLTVTVVIPFYAGIEFLDRTLASLCMQTYPAHLMDVIIVQDGSVEDTSQLQQAYSGRLNITYYAIPRCNGFQAASCRNVGIQNSRSEVILSLDFDIVLTSIALAAHMRWFHVADNVATIGPRRFIDVAGCTSEDIQLRMQEIIEFPDIHSLSNTDATSVLDKRLYELERLKSHTYPCNCFHGCNVAYRRRDAIEVGGWNEEFNGFYGYEDIEFGHRLFSHGLYLVYEPEAIGLHQENEFVSSEQRNIGLEVNRQKLYRLIPGLGEYREKLDRARKTLNQARHSIAAVMK